MSSLLWVDGSHPSIEHSLIFNCYCINSYPIPKSMMGDQEHVFIKLFYPASVGTVSEADLDQLLGALKKVCFILCCSNPCR